MKTILLHANPIKKNVHNPNMLSSLINSFKSLSKSISSDMSISSPNPTKFIEDALFCASQFALSYTDPDQKWIIRQHLISLFQDYPSLKPSVAVFTHNDGTEVKLLNANGELRLSHGDAPVPLTIWVHEFYPHMAPIVFINSGHPIHEDYPFADSSGATASSYLTNWHFTKSNLSGLARNLVKLFSHNHPFHYSGRYSGWAHPSTVSKMEAMDRLSCSIYYDAAAIAAETHGEIDKLYGVEFELKKRAEAVEIVVSEIELEKRRLKVRTLQLWEECDKVSNWLKVYGEGNSGGFAIDDVFEGVDEESKIQLECTAADMAVEDLIYKMDKAVEEGVLSFDVYLRQVRIFAREQFFHREKAKKSEIEKRYQGSRF
ncbi:hypothetical protein ACS0TY_007439 [Phlomoides rotata]